MTGIRRKLTFLFAIGPLCVGCGDALRNLTASLGGSVAGNRGAVRVLFINNTDFRAVFTTGTFDPTDRLSVPDFLQFAPDGGDTLDGDTESDIFDVTCGRVFSIGSPRLLQFIEANAETEDRIEEAFVEGVEFYDTATEEAESLPQGKAPPFEALLGVDFPCNALLILRFETSDATPEAFRVDFELIPSESNR